LAIKRIHQLAKELDLNSKQIIDRLEAEGIPLENQKQKHLNPVSAGLEATIRDWFANSAAAGATATAVAEVGGDPASEGADEAAPSAAPKAAAKKKATRKVEDQPAKPRPALRPARPAPAPSAAASPVETSISAAAREETTSIKAAGPAPSAPPTPVAPRSRDAADTPDAPAPAPRSAPTPRDIPPHTPGSVSAPASSGPSAPARSAPPASAPAARGPVRPVSPNVPSRPSSVTPAGPRLQVTTPAKVSGPTVVRIEQAEQLPTPRSRAGGGSGGAWGPGRGISTGAPTEGGESDASRRNQRRKTGRSGQSGRFAGGAGGRDRTWGEQDLAERQARLRGAHGFIKTVRRDVTRQEGGGPGLKAKTAYETGGVVKVETPFTIKKISSATGVPSAEILKAMVKKGIMTANINMAIPTELAMEVMIDFGIELEPVEQKTAESVVIEQFAKRETKDLRPRSPVVTILGHVDHGKTSLLDKIRSANVAAGEAGGITQHTSAFRVKVRAGEEDKNIVFLDTPGHQAFTSMRARGARITDIVILVVAADDGVMPQTVESINHAKAANVPIIVALNKIDKPEATENNIRRIYGQLAEHELSPVQWGGKTECVHVSATKGVGIQELLDTIDLQAQVMELKADHEGPARGTVIEARLVEGRGPVANVLIQDGRIKVGEYIVIGRAYGKVRDMTDDRGQKVKEAGPATPLEISGLSALPDAGDSCFIVDSLRTAEEAAEHRLSAEREKALSAPKVTLDTIFTQIKDAAKRELNLIVKADVQGSVETLKKTLEEISTEEIRIRVLHSAVGGITESDVLLAETSGAIILGFHVIASSKARELAEQKHVEIRQYQIIYELLDDVKKAASGMLAPEMREQVLGHAEVRQVFKISKVGAIAGCYVTDGVIERNARVRITRQGIVIENNRVLSQLKRFKDDAKDVRAGQECGMKVDGYDDIKEGDVIECYKTIEVKKSL